MCSHVSIFGPRRPKAITCKPHPLLRPDLPSSSKTQPIHGFLRCIRVVLSGSSQILPPLSRRSYPGLISNVPHERNPRLKTWRLQWHVSVSRFRPRRRRRHMLGGVKKHFFRNLMLNEQSRIDSIGLRASATTCWKTCRFPVKSNSKGGCTQDSSSSKNSQQQRAKG